MKYTAIVTGGSKGIGRAICLELAKNPELFIIVNYNSNKSLADEVVNEITSAGGNAKSIKADVSNEIEVSSLFQEANSLFPLKILVNNSGIALYKSIEKTSLDEFKSIFNVNVAGTFLTCREAVKYMVDNGRIINISSSVTALMLPTYGTYSASKAAIEQLTRTLAKELGNKRIIVNAIAPGPVATELFFQGKSEEDIKRLSQMSALTWPGETGPG